MTTLGISLYPEQETMEEMQAYMDLASTYGYTKVFTSMFSVPGEAEAVKVYFKQLCQLAHERNMEVCVDANSQMLAKYGASVEDLQVFQEIGVDEIRMDMCFGDERDQILVNNKEQIKIQFSAFMVNIVKPVIDQLECTDRVTMCHNFYPQRYTGVSRSDFININRVWKQAQTRLAAFITSNHPDAHGPWPVKDGLPTLEEHRTKSVEYQTRDLIALGIDTIYFGNAFASEQELKEAQEAVQRMELVKQEGNKRMEQMAKALMPNLGTKKIALKVKLESDISSIEKEILCAFQQHVDMGDSNEFMLRSRVTRMIYGKQDIPQRPCEKAVFTKGDVLIVNDSLKHYRGEVQVCRSEMVNDGQRNLAGSLSEEECLLLDLVEPGVYFIFFPNA